jgi:ketosteroid isomerase-like protein
MQNPHQDLVENFFQAFQDKDAERMINCYHPEIIFQDPVFGELKGVEVRNMWRMLILNGGDDLKISFSDIEVNHEEGRGKWEAKYLFGRQKRKVHNKISSTFIFREGKIYRHLDSFNFWRWARMALGISGFLLGPTPYLKNIVRRQSLQALQKFSEKNPEPPQAPSEGV